VVFSRGLLLVALLVSSGFWVACGGGTSSAQPGNVPDFGHVFLIVEENHSFADVIGNSSMPFLNSLASQYGLATQYYANTHPSIGNYFMLTTGEIETNDDSFSGTITNDNIVRELLKAGKTWKAYAQSLPSIGFTGGDSYPYAQNHNPFAHFSDVLNNSAQTANLVPFTEFAQDLANNTLPDFSFIVPDLLHDAHDGSLTAADSWLQQNIQPLIASPAFQKEGLLIITFDESEVSDMAHGGGHVATVIVSPLARRDYQSPTLYQHQSTLRLILAGLGVNGFPGASAQAASMSEFF
jgi:phosphatidylinositol-3-phosphatase